MAWMTQREVADQLRVSIKTLQRWRREGRLPFYRLGYRTVRFSSHDVENFGKEKKQ